MNSFFLIKYFHLTSSLHWISFQKWTNWRKMDKHCKLVINSSRFSNDCRQTEHKLKNKPIRKRLVASVIKAGKRTACVQFPPKNCRFVLIFGNHVLLSFKFLKVNSHRTLSFVCHICIENITSAINAVNRLITWFTIALLLTFSQGSLALFRFNLLQTRSQ